LEGRAKWGKFAEQGLGDSFEGVVGSNAGVSCGEFGSVLGKGTTSGSVPTRCASEARRRLRRRLGRALWGGLVALTFRYGGPFVGYRLRWCSR
jgi:hypothetical protein